MYRAKTRVRSRSPTASLSAACSMARKGPTSLPDGLRMPSVAPTRSSQKSVVAAKSRPAPTISAAPSASMRRRPARSARVVTSSDTAVSPSSVRVSSRPIRSGERPAAARWSTSTTERAP